MSGIGHNSRAGWVSISRDIRNHWLVGFKQPVKPMNPEEGSMSRSEAWIDLIMECRYEAGTVMNGGRRMTIMPGQLVGAVSWLAARWNWTPQTVRTFLTKLEENSMIERHNPGVSENNKQYGKQSGIISVCNYLDYQSTAPSQYQLDQQAANKQPTSNQQQYKE